MKKIDIVDLFKRKTDKLITSDKQFHSDLEEFEKHLNDILLRSSSISFNVNSTSYDSTFKFGYDSHDNLELSAEETIDEPYSDSKITCDSRISTSSDKTGNISKIIFSQAKGIHPCLKDSKTSVFEVENEKLFKSLFVSKDLTGNNVNNKAEDYILTPYCMFYISNYDKITRTHFLPNLTIQYVVMKGNPCIYIMISKTISPDSESVKYYTSNLTDANFSFSTLDHFFSTMQQDKIPGLTETDIDKANVLK